MRTKLIVVSMTSIVPYIFIGCASIPPEALIHMTTLEDYHAKTTQGTLKAYNTAAEGIQFTLDKWMVYDDLLGTDYIDATKEAADVFRQINQKTETILTFIKTVEAIDPNKREQAYENIKQEIVALQKITEEEIVDFEGAAKIVAKRTATNQKEFNEHKHAVQKATQDIEALLIEHNNVIHDGIAKQRELLRSYLMAQSGVMDVFGPELGNAANKLSTEASTLLSKYSDAIASAETLMSAFLSEK